MNKRLILALAAFLLPLCSFAQMPDSLAGNLNVSFNHISAGTPAPKGYKPFYISHYGRHGARYLTSDSYYTRTLDCLGSAAAVDSLTPLGKEVYSRLSAFYENHCSDRIGALTSYGWKQQAAIADHLYDSFPSVFRKHPDVLASSTDVQRCIMSMQSFCVELQKRDSKLNIYAQCLPGDLKFLNPPYAKEKPDYKQLPAPWQCDRYDYMRSIFDTQPVLDRLFKKGFKVRKPEKFVYSLYNFMAGMRCHEVGTGVQTLSIFTPDELKQLYKVMCVQFFGHIYPNQAGFIYTLEDIVDKAGEDMARDLPPVRLRFGHETVVISLMMLVGADSFSVVPDGPDEVYKTFRFWRVPMGAALFFVFYRNKSDEVIFKLMLNGDELSLPLTPVEGPYYRWDDFLSYFDGIKARYGY